MAFADDVLVKDRLDELNQTAHDPSITRYLTYAHSKVSTMLREASFDPADIEANPTNYKEYEMLQGAEADLAAGYLIQAVPREDEASRYIWNKPHILVTQGLENVQAWISVNNTITNELNNKRARVVLNQVSSRRDYSDHY